MADQPHVGEGDRDLQRGQELNLYLPSDRWEADLEPVTTVFVVYNRYALYDADAGALPATATDDDDLANTPPVYFDQAQAIISTRCVSCHSAEPSDKLFPAPPGGLKLETAKQIKSAAKRIRVRVQSKTMPFRNRTEMTDEERLIIARSLVPPGDSDDAVLNKFEDELALHQTVARSFFERVLPKRRE